jgi:phosphoserine phosphatase
MSRLVCFDLDGTLVPSPTTVCLHLAQWLGHEDVLARLEVGYAEGRIDNHEVAKRDAIHYTGRTRREVDRELASLPLVRGVPETVRRLRGMNLLLLVATVTWRFAAEHLANRFGFDAVAGCVMGEDGSGRFTGRVERHIEAADKVTFVRSFCEPRGIDLEECVAVGDSRSDIPTLPRGRAGDRLQRHRRGEESCTRVRGGRLSPRHPPRDRIRQPVT